MNKNSEIKLVLNNSYFNNKHAIHKKKNLHFLSFFKKIHPLVISTNEGILNTKGLLYLLDFWKYSQYKIGRKYFYDLNSHNLPKAALPLGVKWGIIPLTAFQNILEGALKCCTPLLGLWLIFLLRNSWNLTLFLKRDPEILMPSVLTTTTFWPLKSSLAT